MDTCIVRPQTALKRISASGKKGFSKRLQSRLWPLALSGILMFSCTSLWASTQTDNFGRLAVVQRAEALRRMSPKLILRPLQPVVLTSPNLPFAAGFPVAEPYPWKYNITTTVFWVGEKAAPQNPVSNEQSAWDPDWMSHYGGSDDPDAAMRRNFIPATFVPGLNPFYVALPYNDIEDHHTRPEAARVIPWFQASFVREGRSVCKGRWVAIRRRNRLCFAQWQDVGPFCTDHWQYVFGDERPRPNANQDAGLDVSPAVREYLGLSGIDRCDWRFVDVDDVPSGPWALYGQDNPLVRLRNQKIDLASSHGGHGRTAGTATIATTADLRRKLSAEHPYTLPPQNTGDSAHAERAESNPQVTQVKGTPGKLILEPSAPLIPVLWQ